MYRWAAGCLPEKFDYVNDFFLLIVAMHLRPIREY